VSAEVHLKAPATHDCCWHSTNDTYARVILITTISLDTHSCKVHCANHYSISATSANWQVSIATRCTTCASKAGKLQLPRLMLGIIQLAMNYTHTHNHFTAILDFVLDYLDQPATER